MINHMMCLFLYIYIYMCVCCDLLCYKLRVIKGGGGDVAISGRELPVDYRGLFESPTLANKPYEHVTPFPYLYLYLPPSTADATAWGLSCARLTHTLGQIQQFSAATSNYELIIVSDDNRSVARRDTLNAGAVAWAVALGWGGGAVAAGSVRGGSARGRGSAGSLCCWCLRWREFCQKCIQWRGVSRRVCVCVPCVRVYWVFVDADSERISLNFFVRIFLFCFAAVRV